MQAGPLPRAGPTPPSIRRGLAPSPRPHPASRRRNHRCPIASSPSSSTPAPTSQAERFVAELAAAGGEDASLSGQLGLLVGQARALQTQIDAAYGAAFEGLAVEVSATDADGAPTTKTVTAPRYDEQSFGALGRTDPPFLSALLAAKAAADPAGWRTFQAAVSDLKARRSRAEGEAGAVRAALEAAAAQKRAAERRAALVGEVEESSGGASTSSTPTPRTSSARVVVVTGFEAFNARLYEQAAADAAAARPGLVVSVFSDADISGPRRGELEAALSTADAFFGSLLFDYDQVAWLKERTAHVPVRLCFESALELMGTTRLGSFTMGGAPGEGGDGAAPKPAGPPPAVKKMLSMFGSGKEEDRMVGYLSFLKVGPSLLRFIPGKKAGDLAAWLTIYGYWNGSGRANVRNMLVYLADTYLRTAGETPGTSTTPPPPQKKREWWQSLPLPTWLTAGTEGLNGESAGASPAAAATAPPPPPPPPVEVAPLTGCIHPARPGHYFPSAAAYMTWRASSGRDAATAPGSPVVAVLLYRKHVTSELAYIPHLISLLEKEGLVPIPIFINGVEAHTVVRDALTSAAEMAAGAAPAGAVRVDGVISTIGFPLVGGPAGTMAGGRNADVAREILMAKDIPYFVATPLLVQDIASWAADGVGGLQSVVTYALPELDGAIDSYVLGGLAAGDVFLVPERVRALARRVRAWCRLRATPAKDRRVAALVYGFPPGVGATGTAALLNVPASLDALFTAMEGAGYDLGPGKADGGWVGAGDAVVEGLRAQQADARATGLGAEGLKALGPGEAAAAFGATVVAADISPATLRSWLSFPASWGPSEWGPLPFLPAFDVLPRRLEKQWGELEGYRGIATSAKGSAVVGGVALGNVLCGMQPLLGLEGDPMRLLFERDLTPHPQYAAFYQWLQRPQPDGGYDAHAVLHVGMHGTVEWLPGPALGNTGLSWSEVCLGALPNVYIYAANNPSESVLAKRRGYGVLVSYNVPPYGRAGLYKQLAELSSLLADLREEEGSGTEPAIGSALREPIASLAVSCGLTADCPPPLAAGSEATPETIASLTPGAFRAWAGALAATLRTTEARLFSSGLHTLGAAPDATEAASYLGAYFGERLPEEVVAAIAAGGGVEGGLAAVPGGASPLDPALLSEAADIAGLLARTPDELSGVLTALDGRYVPAAPGGDLLRDGPGVLPTGRNIHALDPYRMPSAAAMVRGSATADAILAAHLEAHAGTYPETVAVNLWGLDAIKTRGESVATVLRLVGAVPVSEGTGRVGRFELLPLSELTPPGRPRIDVLCNLSGIFRDTYANVVDLLDDLFARAAAAPGETPDQNFIKKHASSIQAAAGGDDAADVRATSRLFCNPPGDYGSMVGERIGAGNWEDGGELGDTWAARNAFSYGKGGERGSARPDVLQALLATTDRVVQTVDSVEYGLTDIQEYFANTGALARAAADARTKAGRVVAGPSSPSSTSPSIVPVSIVEAVGDAPPRDLDTVLRLEYRTKLLNPKWAAAQLAQGSGGAFEISQRMTAAVGWGGTTGFKADWVWQQAVETYVLDAEVAGQLKKSNPEAFRNVVKRALEAAGRGLWENPDAEVLEALKRAYSDVDDQLEGV